ncbi:hypothetical protein L2E82_44716 [Cichorium intybus]|uniref:Uncharacterized protein n=1 Tax=Cichorium intybus TaxID=13427 RepID=A0ACB8ZR15_CICIN|nr:hypothetical protein L2E82_44716 [Cichorium intybus]
MPSWVIEEEFGMGYLDLKPAPSLASKSVYVATVTSNVPPSETASGRPNPTSRTKPSENKHESGSHKVKGGSLSNGSDASMPPGPSSHKQIDDSGNDNSSKSTAKRSVPATSVSKQPKQDVVKNEAKSKAIGRGSNDRDESGAPVGSVPSKGSAPTPAPAPSTRSSEAETAVSKLPESTEPNDAQKRSSSRPSHSPRTNVVIASKSNDKPTKRTSPAEEHDRFIKRRKGEHDVDPDRERHVALEKLEKHHVDFDKVSEKSKDERYDRERFHKSTHGDDMVEKYSRERSVDRGKDERSKQRYNDVPAEKSASHADDRSRGHSLPPPPPLPPHLPPHLLASQEDAKRRREEEFRDRKRDERDGFSTKIDERERERERERDGDREKVNPIKEEVDPNGSKRRKLKREHLAEAGEYSPAAPPLNINMTPSSYDMRDRADRKAPILQRPVYIEEPGTRMHGKDVPTKMNRRDSDPYPSTYFNSNNSFRPE